MQTPVVAVRDRLGTFRTGLVTALQQAGFEAATPADVSGWLAAQRDRVAAAVVSVSAPDLCVAALRRHHARLPVVALVDADTVEACRQALLDGATSVLPRTAGTKAIVDATQAAIYGRATLPVSATAALLARLSADVAITDEERRVLVGLAQGNRIVDVASRLGCSPRTVQRRVRSLCAKLEVANPAHAVAEAHRLGLMA